MELADRLGIQYVWEVEHHFLEEYSHSSAPEVFLAACSQRTQEHPPRPRDHPHRARLQPPGPHRRAGGDARPRVERPGRVRLGRVVERGRAGRLRHRPAASSASSGWRASRSPSAAWSRSPFTGVDGEYVQMPPRNVVPKPVQKPHPPLWVACSRRDTILLAAEKGMGALTFAFIDPEEARSWVAEYERTLAESCVPVGWSRQPAGGLREPDDAAPRRGRGHPPRRRGRQLLRLLARPLLRLRRAPARRDRRVERVRAAARGAGLRPRGGGPGGQGGAARRQGGGRRHDRAARRHRHPRPGPRVPPPLRGGRRRPGHLRAAGRAQPARAHHGVDRAVRPRGAARVRSTATRPRRSRRPSGWSRSSTRRWPASPTRPRDLGDYSFPAIPRQWADAAGSEEMRAWLEHFADDRAAGKRDTELGIAG